MRQLLALFIVLTTVFNPLYSQQEYPTETRTHVFWQKSRVLSQDDFGGPNPTDPKLISYCDTLGMCSMAYVGLYSVLDVPKKKSKQGELMDLVYFAPAFDKSKSYIIGEDSLGYQAQKLVFDIKEITARKARMELQVFRDSMPNTFGVNWTFYKSAEAKAIDFEHLMMQSFIHDVYLNNDVNVDGLKKWEDTVKEFLNKTEEYATKPEECYRFVINEPFVKGYKKAKKVTGNIWEER